MAARDQYNTIVMTENPRGRFWEGTIEGTPKPGTIMQIKAATELVGGRPTFVVYDRAADGERPQGPLLILCEDDLQGKTIDDAYVTGTRGKVYIPLPGDEVLGLVADVAGTDTDTIAIGALFIVDDGTGKLNATTGTPESEPFMALETSGAAAAVADRLIHMVYTGY